VLSLWPSGRVLLQHSFLAHRGSLSVIRHPTLRHFLHVEAFCAVDVVLPILRCAPVCGVLFRPTRPLRSCQRITDRGASRRGRAATRLSDTGRIDAHNASLALLLTLRHCQAGTSSPFSRLFVCLSPRILPISRDAPARLAKVVSSSEDGFSLSPTHNVSTNERLTGSLSPSFSLSHSLSHSLKLSCSLTLSLSVVSCPQTTDDGFSLSLFRTLALSLTHSLSLAFSLSRSLALLLSRSLALSLSRSCSLAPSLSCSLALSLSLFLSSQPRRHR